MLLIFCCDLINYNNVTKVSENKKYKTNLIKIKFINNKFVVLFTVEYIGDASNLRNFDDNSNGYNSLKNWFDDMKLKYNDMECLTSKFE
jgi:hypothetical protein